MAETKNKNQITPKEVSILLIENNKKDIQTITEFINKSHRINANIQTVDSIKKAKTIIFYQKIDIMLIDLNIEKVKFEELFERFSKESLSIPYIVITDERDEDMGIEAVQKGAQDYLVRSELSERILRRTIIYSIERHEILQSLYKTTIVDELTGLYNRRGLHTLGNQQVELAKRHNDDIFIFYLDLDGMKEINDTLGHDYGDKALLTSSKIMHRTFRTTDILSRIGGDEFVVVAVKAQYEFIPIIIQRIKDYIKEENDNLKDYQISMSIGVSKVDLDHEAPLEDAIKNADKEMYRVKVENKKERK
tara:strand:+ start:3440 stop:4357 length:918 start_codon:yes stop_codon:yes gene_type:complete